MTTDNDRPSLPAPQNDNPSRDTWLASLLDPAFDRDHPDWPELRDRYAQTRAVADLARLPTVPEQHPVLWRVRALSAVARTAIYAQTSLAAQRLTALRFALAARVDGPRAYGPDGVQGAEVRFALVRGAAVPQVEDAAVDAQASEFGGLWLDELGEVVIHRTNAPRRVYLPFPLLLPSTVL